MIYRIAYLIIPFRFRSWIPVLNPTICNFLPESQSKTSIADPNLKFQNFNPLPQSRFLKFMSQILKLDSEFCNFCPTPKSRNPQFGSLDPIPNPKIQIPNGGPRNLKFKSRLPILILEIWKLNSKSRSQIPRMNMHLQPFFLLSQIKMFCIN